MVPPDHFLRKLDEVVDWRPFTKKLVRYYKGGAEYGPPPYEPVLLLKMLLLSYLYDLSERQTEDLVSHHLPAKWFVGLAVDEAAPDHASLTVFKQRLLARRGAQVFGQLFEAIVGLARERGVRFGRIQVVDSVHTVADVNVEQDEGRQHGGQGPRDPDAAWGAKGKKRRRDASGQPQVQREYFFGYKAHVSMNAEAGIITSVADLVWEHAGRVRACKLGGCGALFLASKGQKFCTAEHGQRFRDRAKAKSGTKSGRRT